MAAEGDAIITFIFNGEHMNDIPRDVTHLIIHENITVIPAFLFIEHPNLVEVYCHSGVIKIEHTAFCRCKSLRRVIISGVVIVEGWAFDGCENLMYFECDKLERIGVATFNGCNIFGIINLPSAKIVERYAFCACRDMREVVFGKDLESIEGRAFIDCNSLESITIPLKNGLITEDDTFYGCVNLKRVDLIESEVLCDLANSFLMESWKNDFHEALDSINRILPNTDPGDDYNNCGKTIAIREWIESVLLKVTHYKAAHSELLNEAATALQLSLPNDIVMNNILSFVKLPPHAIDGEDEAAE